MVLFLYLLTTTVQAQQHDHGFIDTTREGKLQVWNLNKRE